MNDETETRPPIVAGAPNEIWLVYGELDHDDTHDELSRSGEVAWSPSKEFPSDVRYVRADLVPEPNENDQRRIDELEEALTTIALYAHDNSSGPAVPDHLWEIRRMAYDAL